MKRRDRALIIRDRVLALNAIHGEWQTLGSTNARIIKDEGWTAQLHTPFNPDCWSRVEALRPHRTSAVRIFPNRMCLWPDGLYKTFAVEWSDDRFRIITYRRGAWEALFGFDPYSEEELARLSPIYCRCHRGKWRS